MAFLVDISAGCVRWFSRKVNELQKHRKAPRLCNIGAGAAVF
ncbi:hypothetical protein [Labrys wisconsinensis]|uniref:Ribosomal protein S30 n=1 Tax=Labrys wisconsinensis TaxID=425677 RepID=A0ABU0JG65_9HYPH|nr:hypothetical protein [Labrys wisconsinensis]MDQ0472560.1 ribosomal protein S30 [Labrys wisconsinensis]